MSLLSLTLHAVHALLALAIIVLVLLQHGKGADVGATFGGGGAGSLFGASGSATFLSRTTAVCAALFFASSLALTYLAQHPAGDTSVVDRVKQPVPAGQQQEKEVGSKAKDIPK